MAKRLAMLGLLPTIARQHASGAKLAQGAALGDVTMLAGFDEDITAAIPHGSQVEIDPEKKTIRVV